MKLLRFGAASAEKPGLLDKDGTIRDLSGVVSDITPETLKNGAIAKIAAIDPATLPAVEAGVRLGPIVNGVRNFIAVGLNYVDHAHETGSPIPSEPILFNKAPNCIVGPNDTVIIPKNSQKTDWEVELAIVIGKTASYISEAEAIDHIAGYAVCHDVSERHFQTERGGQWMKGKGSPTFGPLGPWLVTPDEVADVQNLDMFLDLNGTRVQTGNTKTMIFGVAHLVSYISQFLQLDPGDVITTGTPPGVGMGMKPPKFLKDGDQVRLGIAGLGEQQQTFRAWSA
ncbi:fumarylacetoacetate hydrolase family protein [Kaistia geumhonensis]|uniref:2-keto-4-pentenoate hydratase/2-oxohepta-3-ene-1,7-dioic acid hydratase in catechol pathway n=1 Tax=Kaistia geumhonensis TaxID=410839 RepID=A0ABU0M361_9HYPH|nr:fumarylacetoacetate hydrolase family protein [Kaistia geumhonensis]MCX5479366.1 fumarylacetoacetate hydrolase family protein [Kaistia geumhonensis]MDQ0515411.1 2-keto-4-pentenoate hydratase/2-oxohepta-3-ene-1,7-dioic acid hydratase in catechol pathway [Kaistia geumhonensis]